MEREIKQVMNDLGCDYLQARRHVQARAYLRENSMWHLKIRAQFEAECG